jgi:hypothetical protein
MSEKAMRKSRKGIREIGWGYNASDDESCIYDNGHLDRAKFITDIQLAPGLDTPKDVLIRLTVSDVKHMRFRPMSPSEAKAWGGDWGVMDCTEEGRGYPVTAVILE